MVADEAKKNLLHRNKSEKARYVPPEGDWNPNLPYGGKVYMARKMKPDSWYVRIAELLLVFFVVWLIYFSYFHFDRLHFHVVHAYAHLGHAEAQHQTGQRYLHGMGVDKHTGKAVQWFKAAAEKGHAKASYDLAVSHVKGYDTGLPKGDAKRLFHHAAHHGVAEAQEAINEVCSRGGCED